MTSKPSTFFTKLSFAVRGEMETLMQERFFCAEGNTDWAHPTMGAPETWPSTLKTAVQMMLGSHSPMFIWWGPQFINFYNDAYISILGSRHPAGLGQSAFEIWSDLWTVIGVQAESVLREGKPSWIQELLLMIERNGAQEEAYFTFSYSPIKEKSGETSGVFCTVTEETKRVLSDRRLRMLRQLTTETTQTQTIEETCRICTESLGRNPHDIPFALIYRFDGNRQIRLVSSTGLAANTTADHGVEGTAPYRLHQWVLQQERAVDEPVVIENLVEQFGALPGGAWAQSPNRALILPLAHAGQNAFGFLLVGVSPHCPLDDDYQGFFDLVASHITTAIARAQPNTVERYSPFKIQMSDFKILLVDDDIDRRTAVEHLLRQHWQVETADNGAIALTLIQRHPPDLVLIDEMMPARTGLQLLSALRNDTQTNPIPIIFASARAGEASTGDGLEADEYLIKPFTDRELITRVKTQLQLLGLRKEQWADRFKSELLMTVTRELQAPLAAILGWTRLIQSKSVDPVTMARALATIERNALIEARLMKNLLDVYTIFTGDLRLKSQLVDLGFLVHSVTAAFREACEAKNIELVETPLPVALGNVLADGDRLKQVIANLLENAIKFTPEGGQVTLELERLDSGVQITVSDTGIGIHPDFLPYVFDRFTQAEVPSRHIPGGVGIGLAIARHLVELHHGTIEVASNGEGQGATFTIRLPLTKATTLSSNIHPQNS